MSWNTNIIIICILLAVFTAYREYQRANKVHLWWRIAVVLCAVISLACIILPVTYLTTVTQNRGAGKILLTDGFSRDSLSKIDSIYTLDANVHQQYPKAKLLTDVGELFAYSTHTTPIHVLGYGLDIEELTQLKGKQIIFDAPALPDGFAAISWTENIKAGQQIKVEGTYKNTSTKAVKVLLKGLNSTLDSVMAPLGSLPTILLSGTPKSTGKLVYELIALSGNDTLQHERLPVIIEPTQAIKVLLLSSSPDFEVKFLKNWLGGNGYGVASRSVITKDKFGQEFVNMDQQDLSRLTAPLLSKFDLIIGDLSAFKGLTPSENSTLQQEVSQKGLGIIIRADSLGKGSTWLQNGFSVSHQTGKPATGSTLTINGKKSINKLAVSPDYINSQNNTQTSVTNGQGQALAAIALYGAGKTVFTTINNSYSWMLAGNQTDYTTLWTALIDKALRKPPVIKNWSVATSLPAVNQPTELILESSATPTAAQIGQTTAYPSTDRVMPFKKSYTYWPSTYGWQQAKQLSGKPYWWYTWQTSDWKTLKATKKIELTSNYARHQNDVAAVTKQIQQKSRAAVPKIYFYMLFLMAATYLWAESKFFS